jgi:hypothetical protein
MHRKAYIRYALVRSFRSALKLHGSKLGGHELCVTEWPEFPWYKEEGSKTISAGDAGLVDQHTAEASFGTQELFSVAAGNTSTPLKLSQSCEVPEVQKDSNGHTSWRGNNEILLKILCNLDYRFICRLTIVYLAGKRIRLV